MCDDVPEVSDFLDFLSHSEADSVISELSISELFDLFDLFEFLESDFDFSIDESLFDEGITGFVLDVELAVEELDLFEGSRYSVGASNDSVFVVDGEGLLFLERDSWISISF